MKIHEFSLDVDGRTVHAYDTGGPGTPIFWQHGTPNLGSPPRPLFDPSLRWISHDRPSYGGSSPFLGRAVGSVAEDVAAIADALGIERFALMGHSGGGSHALAAAALLPERVTAVVSISANAPYGGDGLDFFDGMGENGIAALRAALKGREEMAAFEASEEGGIDFIDEDWAALKGEWGWMGEVAGAASRQGPDGLLDDEVAYVSDWGCSLADIKVPTLLLHGGRDLVVPAGHGKWLSRTIPSAEFRFYPEDGHLSILKHARSALEWL